MFKAFLIATSTLKVKFEHKVNAHYTKVESNQYISHSCFESSIELGQTCSTQINSEEKEKSAVHYRDKNCNKIIELVRSCAKSY